MKKISVITSGRQDWGILRNPVKCLQMDSDFEISIIAGGMACSDRYGNIADQIEKDGLHVRERMNWDLDAEMGMQTAEALKVASDVLKKSMPDAVMLLGDRFETFGFAQAAFFQKIPIIHLHGGEETEGALDNQIRHAITKLSDLHFVSCRLHAERVKRMGENPESVFIVGAPGLDNLHRDDLPDLDEVLLSLGIKKEVEDYLFLITYHPPTLGTSGKEEFNNLLDALEEFAGVCIITVPNNDSGSKQIYEMAEDFVAENRFKRVLVDALGEKRYWSLLKEADLVLGNSSSGIIEAPAVPVPVLNIGDRQKGRGEAPCVINIPVVTVENIIDGIKKSVCKDFLESLDHKDSIFGDGYASEKIRKILKSVDFGNMRKYFHTYHD